MTQLPGCSHLFQHKLLWLSGIMHLLLLIKGICLLALTICLQLPSPDGRRMLPKGSPLLNLEASFSTKLSQALLFLFLKSLLLASHYHHQPTQFLHPCLRTFPLVHIQMFSFQALRFLGISVSCWMKCLFLWLPPSKPPHLIVHLG